MSLSKITFFSSLFIDIFFNTLFAFLLRYALSGKRYKYSYSSLREKCPNTEFFLVRIFPHSDWIRRDIFFEFFIKDVFVFVWPIISSNMNNDVVRLLFTFGIKWNIKSSVFALEKITPLSFCYVRVSFPSNLLLLSPLLLT